MEILWQWFFTAFQKCASHIILFVKYNLYGALDALWRLNTKTASWNEDLGESSRNIASPSSFPIKFQNLCKRVIPKDFVFSEKYQSLVTAFLRTSILKSWFYFCFVLFYFLIVGQALKEQHLEEKMLTCKVFLAGWIELREARWLLWAAICIFKLYARVVTVALKQTSQKNQVCHFHTIKVTLKELGNWPKHFVKFWLQKQIICMRIYTFSANNG